MKKKALKKTENKTPSTTTQPAVDTATTVVVPKKTSSYFPSKKDIKH